VKWTPLLTGILVAVLFQIAQTEAADFQFRFGFEHGVLLPSNASLYDNKNSVQFPEFKEGLYWPSGWGIEFSQRLISPQNRFLVYGLTTGQLEPRGEDRYHLRYSLPLVFSVRYDFEKDRKAIFHPYVAGGLGLYLTGREFEQTRPPVVIDKVDRQAPVGPMFTAGMELLRTGVKGVVEFKHEIFFLNETFEGAGDNGTGGGTSLSIGVIF